MQLYVCVCISMYTSVCEYVCGCGGVLVRACLCYQSCRVATVSPGDGLWCQSVAKAHNKSVSTELERQRSSQFTLNFLPSFFPTIFFLTIFISSSDCFSYPFSIHVSFSAFPLFSLSTPMPSLFHYRYIFPLLSTVFMLYVFTSIFSSLASVSPTWFLCVT